MNAIKSALLWLAHEAWEKINIFGTIREMKELGKKYGRRFFIMAVIWECIEDGLFPYLSWRAVARQDSRGGTVSDPSNHLGPACGRGL